MISVIMPAYNAEKFIGEAIQSILDQTLQQFELIIVDDGSKDSTVDIIKKYQEKDNRIVFIQNSHGGACKARNDAVAVAQYAWVAPMDADDIALPNRLERMLKAAEADPEVVVWGTYFYQINVNGKIIGEVHNGPTSRDEFYAIDRSKSVIMVTNPTSMFKKDIFLKVGGYNEQLSAAQELELWDRMAEHGPILVINEPLLKYRLHGSSISTDRYFEQRMLHGFAPARYKARQNNRELSLAEYIQEYKSKPFHVSMIRYIKNTGQFYYRNAGVQISEGKRIQALGSFALALMLDPVFTSNRLKRRLSLKLPGQK